MKTYERTLIPAAIAAGKAHFDTGVTQWGSFGRSRHREVWRVIGSQLTVDKADEFAYQALVHHSLTAMERDADGYVSLGAVVGVAICYAAGVNADDGGDGEAVAEYAVNGESVQVRILCDEMFSRRIRQALMRLHSRGLVVCIDSTMQVPSVSGRIKTVPGRRKLYTTAANLKRVQRHYDEVLAGRDERAQRTEQKAVRVIISGPALEFDQLVTDLKALEALGYEYRIESEDAE